MPFDSNHVWKPPTKEQVDNFHETFREKEETVLPPHIARKVEHAISSSKIQYKDVNKKIYETVTNLRHSGAVDIIIPVYGALHVVRPCIESVLDRTDWPFRLIIVDDASPGLATRNYLDHIVTTQENIILLRNKTNRGFVASVNRGLRASINPYACILNSDTVVTPRWMTKMVMAMESDDKIHIVNPVTNNTALLNVPMKPGASYLDMNRALESLSPRAYPDVIPTGFCFMIRTSLLNEIGYLDEGFGVGYGEETDYWLKTVTHKRDGRLLGWRAVLADDTYIFHQRSSSFNQMDMASHKAHRASGSERFHMLNPNYKEWAKGYDHARTLAPLRENYPPETLNKESEYNVAWIVKHPGVSGGMQYITDIVNEYIERGINAKIVCISDKENITVIDSLRTQPIMYKTPEECIANFGSQVFNNGVVFAAVAELVPTVIELSKKLPDIVGMHHVQSYDAALSDKAEVRQDQTNQYGKLPSICSSGWVAKEIENEGKGRFPVILPGVDEDIFNIQYAERDGDRKTLLISINPSYSWKGSNRAIEMCKTLIKICKRKHKEIRIMAYGVNYVPECREIIGLGVVSSSRIATLLRNEADVFVDPAHIHSYGLPSLEAMMCGIPVVSWDNRGIHEYANDNDVDVKILPNNTPPEKFAEEVFSMLFEIKGIRGAGTAFKHEINSRKISVTQFIENVEKIISVKRDKKDIVIVTPHLRKHGGPTTILNIANIYKHLGHNTSVTAIHDDFNHEVLKMSTTPIDVGQSTNEHSSNQKPSLLVGSTKEIYPKAFFIRECDVLIVNSDNPFSAILAEATTARKKILLKLSHNARFKALEENSLNVNWDRIITSTEWLRQACINKLEGWEHKEWKPDKVTRVGWYHYNHPIFDCNPQNRVYGSIDATVRIGTLIHSHPLKGSNEAITIYQALRKKYSERVTPIGVGDGEKVGIPWMQYFNSPSRLSMAEIMSQTDIWLSCSHTEGLGRMALEAMSSGGVVVAADTGAEFLKHEENCLLFPVGQLQEGAEQVQRLLEDRQLFVRLLQNSYETACNMANPNPYVANLQRVIEEVCDE
jgi:GT2 family glycosyltransferase/glycosyltransferase involved in cell wall biosynthesis